MCRICAHYGQWTRIIIFTVCFRNTLVFVYHLATSWRQDVSGASEANKLLLLFLLYNICSSRKQNSNGRRRFHAILQKYPKQSISHLIITMSSGRFANCTINIIITGHHPSTNIPFRVCHLVLMIIIITDVTAQLTLFK